MEGSREMIRLTDADKAFLLSMHIEPPDFIGEDRRLRPGMNRQFRTMPGFGNLRAPSRRERKEIKEDIDNILDDLMSDEARETYRRLFGNWPRRPQDHSPE